MDWRPDFSSLVALAWIAATACACGDQETSGGDGGAGGGTTAATTTTGATGSGTGGSAAGPDFSLFIVPAAVDIPYGGTTPVDLRIDRRGGFDAPIEVKVSAPPAGLTAPDLTIPPGAANASLAVGASGQLAAGTTFDLKLVALSGDTVHVAAVPATVVGVR